MGKLSSKTIVVKSYEAIDVVVNPEVRKVVAVLDDVGIDRIIFIQGIMVNVIVFDEAVDVIVIKEVNDSKERKEGKQKLRKVKRSSIIKKAEVVPSAI